jgi:rare lipoprotein A
LRLEKLAKEGQFPLLTDNNELPLPQTVAASKPNVNLRAKTTRALAQKPKSSSSAVDLLASSRGINVVETSPVETDIWVQIGAFHSETNAQNLINQFSELSSGNIFQISKDGRILYRARLGPLSSVNEADKLLHKILQRGFDGAEIVVD